MDLTYKGAGDNTPVKHHILPNKNTNIRNELPLFELLASGIPWNPANFTEYIARTNVYPPKLDDETLLLKTPPT